MKFKFVWVGKTKSAPLRELLLDYTERLSRFSRVEVSEIKDRASRMPEVERKRREGEELLSRVPADSLVAALDERGKELSSTELSSLIEREMEAGTKQMTFLVGGHAGLSRAVLERANHLLALSRLTLTHEFARVLLVEQVYRAFTIMRDIPYQK